MMQTKLLLSGIILSLVSACGGGGSVSPTNEVDPQASDVVNGYHLVNSTSYNEFDQVISEWRRTANYDQNSLDSTSTSYDSEGNIVSSSEIRSFYDEMGRLVREEYTRDNESDTTTYEFNSRGLLQRSSRDGVQAYTMDFEYNEVDRLVSKRRVWTRNGEVSSTVDYVYSYNDQGLLVSANQVENEPADAVTGETNSTTVASTYVHDNLGRIVRRERVTTTTTLGTSTEQSRVSDFSYDQNGNVVEELLTEPDFITRYENTYELSEEPIFNTWLRRFRYFP